MKANFKLKQARAERDMTQQELAQAIGLSLMAYNLKENGKRAFVEEEIAKICTVLDKSADDIFFNQ
ncbi:helix-turn-helix transcriptional regulator [Gudongella sp. SC589]|uniref:helix-turn-helix transcriptional regulator n=1 Tax=Gudongella sp. SC589 TaxID=3385990 RepID=UPI0039049A37